jgi:diphosphomevalonate decarboxylase
VSGKATATAPANIAFVKYWGAHDLSSGIPLNASISMTLSRCVSTCTVEATPGDAAAGDAAGGGARGESDEVYVVGPGEHRPAPDAFARRVLDHLERLRRWAGADCSFRVATRNSFPSGAGLASSASGFAALTLATVGALGAEVTAEELSILARRSGSGSAARSVLGGYVELPGGPVPDDVYARQLAEPGHWDLRDVIAIVVAEPKAVSSLEGHARAPSSPYFRERLACLADRLAVVREALARRDFDLLGPAVEEEAVDLHLIAMSSSPPIFYWKPGTLEVMEAVRRLRTEGVSAYFTMDAGPNVHVICPAEAEETVASRLGALGSVREIIRDRVGPGPELIEEHLL